MSILWWEKTVEYSFVKSHVNVGDLIAPFDGNQEAAGDAILSAKDRKWILIEFKRNLKSIEKDLEKFDRYDDAKFELEDISGHHFFIYGANVNSKLTLIARNYFSDMDLLDFGEIFDLGAESIDFFNYIERFTSYKTSIDGSGTGGLEIENYGCVVGIRDDGSVSDCLSLVEVCELIQQKVQQRLAAQEKIKQEQKEEQKLKQQPKRVKLR
ncbi:TPA: hypothetical protein ACX3HS_001868 [Vibrio parahaemolyticus]|uniref:hypothetical protein n=1 Tax=Vibrio parahaemolyticus TaxID=670 RepID=UPI000EA0F98C|nr:hypothetical protein [Vibrio parahaemolyticus]AYF15593.1 hypothetical protein FORC72_1862 [Vibrio parahaemolyticus]HAV1390447.1 hypothetical protein [Vibrio parahaemolyticus]HCG5270054.1 hypothetical protein [Vibrio parahaemolyticus]